MPDFTRMIEADLAELMEQHGLSDLCQLFYYSHLRTVDVVIERIDDDEAWSKFKRVCAVQIRLFAKDTTHLESLLDMFAFSVHRSRRERTDGSLGTVVVQDSGASKK